MGTPKFRVEWSDEFRMWEIRRKIMFLWTNVAFERSRGAALALIAQTEPNHVIVER